MCKPREATISWLHLALCKPLMASEPASHVKPVTKQTFGRASPEAAREAAPRAVPNGAQVTGVLGCCVVYEEIGICFSSLFVYF